MNEFDSHGHSAGYLGCVIAMLYFLTIYALEKLGSSTVWRPGFRGFLADYAYVVRVLSYRIVDMQFACRVWRTKILDRDSVLGRICPLPWEPQVDRYHLRPGDSRVLSHAGAGLAHSLLGAGCEVDLRGAAVWVFNHASFLL